jgi:hypothetical protein
VWDARTGTPLLNLKGHIGEVWSVAFSRDGTRIVTRGGDENKPVQTKVWDARSGTELKGAPIPPTIANNWTSPDGRFFAHPEGNRVELIPLRLNEEELSHRLLHTQPNAGRYREGYEAARAARDDFAARFYLDRILSLPTQRTTARFQQRNALRADPCLIARTSFHHPALAKTPYDSGVVALLAMKGDRLAERLLAQEYLRNGKPGRAIPLLIWCMSSRPATSPPVEELLLAKAYLALKQPDEAKRFHRAAIEWLDRPGQPIRAANVVTQRVLNPWAGLVAAVADVDDPRRNPFDWESWHECDVFRVVVEKALATR